MPNKMMRMKGGGGSAPRTKLKRLWGSFASEAREEAIDERVSAIDRAMRVGGIVGGQMHRTKKKKK